MKHSKANVFMVAILSVAFFLSLSVHSAHGQWAATYGGAYCDYAYSIQQTSDEGYIVAGFRASSYAGFDDAWVMKLDNTGAISWQKTYGGEDHDYARSAQQTADGGYIVAGHTKSFGAGDHDAWVMKLDGTGAITWQKTYGGVGSDSIYSIRQTQDGGYIVAGNTYSFGVGDEDIWIMKLDPAGAITWQNTYGGVDAEHPSCIQQTSDGGYIVAGQTTSFGAGNADAWVMKLDTTGAITWQKTYGGASYDSTYSLQQTQDGGYILAGRQGNDAWILKIDSAGAITWQKTYGGTNDDYIYSVQQTQDGGYVAAGSQRNDGHFATSEALVLKLDSSGSIGSCPFEGVSSAVVADTTVTGADTTVVSASTTVTGVDTTATVSDTSVAPNQWCPLTEDTQKLKVGITPKKKGEGTIVSGEGLLSCPDKCQQEYNQGLTVTLYADPSDLSTFLGWKPASLGCERTDPCTVPMDKKKTVKAVFQGPNKLKVVTTFKKGGSGSVASNDTFISCPGDCEEPYKLGTPVTLTATPGENSYFVKWTGRPCKDETTNECTFPMDKNATVKAIFQPNPE